MYAKKSAYTLDKKKLILGFSLVILFALLCVTTQVGDYLWNGVKICAPIVLIAVGAAVLAKVLFFCTHRKPLTLEQIRMLARYKAVNYFKKKYVFKKGYSIEDHAFVTKLDKADNWYDINEPISVFPKKVASYLIGKPHNFTVLAIERDGIVRKMRIDRGSDNSGISFRCDIYDVIRTCKNISGYSVLRFHNHSASEYSKQQGLKAGQNDMISAGSCAEMVGSIGKNWFDFVCSGGDFTNFYSRISEAFEVKGETVSDIIDKCGICPMMDYKLQKELLRKGRPPVKTIDKNLLIRIVICIILVLLLIGIVGKFMGL